MAIIQRVNTLKNNIIYVDTVVFIHFFKDSVSAGSNIHLIIENGAIICKNANLNDVNLLLKEINYKNLEIVYLSEIISEENMRE